MSSYSPAADWYDLLYHWKSYRDEAERIASVIRRRSPHAATVLDVACGTGQHARHLAVDHGFTVAGIDLEPRFVERAHARHPAGSFARADMRSFDLGRTFDAVICLFGSIGYAQDVDGLTRTVAAMARHLAPDGALIVEPWFEPGTMQPGFVVCHTGEGSGIRVCRMSHTTVEARTSILHFEYLIGTADGLRRESEVHRLGLFTRTEMEAALGHAGLVSEYDPAGPTGRGLYVATRRA